MRVHIDTESCARSGYCKREAPELFEVGEDWAFLKEGVDPNSVEPQRIRRAAEACPWRAIEVEE